MIWIIRRYVFPMMTRIALSRGSLEFPVFMTGNTCNGSVHPSKWKRCEIMVEALSPSERCYAMTSGTFRREPGRGVIWIFCCLEVPLVTTHARRWRPHILMCRRIAMATLTIHRRMATNKRETCLLVPLDHIWNAPRLGRMTARAVHSKFTLVHIGVATETVGTLRSELQSLMARSTVDSLVATNQGKACCGMVEPRVSFHLPRGRGMTGLTIQLDWSMWRDLGHRQRGTQRI